MTTATWKRPTGRCHLHTDDQCVEVSFDAVPGQVAVRNSTRPEQPWTTFTHTEWTAFLAQASDFAVPADLRGDNDNDTDKDANQDPTDERQRTVGPEPVAP
jgi:hypothetical protein